MNLNTNTAEKINTEQNETLESFISDKNIHPISTKARFTGFKYRSKVEFLKFFIV